jgi:hypothetical protein
MTGRVKRNDRKSTKTEVVALRVTKAADETEKVAIARTVLRPSIRAADTWSAFSPRYRGVTDLVEMTDELAKQSSAVNSGNMSRPEAILVAQAHSLDAIFNELARRAALNMGEYLDATDTYLRLALRAQSQCRATLETLSIIKNPQASVAIVKQANIAHGPQQVNNGTSPNASTRAEENSNPSNELLEHQRGTRLDRGTTGLPSSADPSLVPVAQINGPEERTGNAALKSERD